MENNHWDTEITEKIVESELWADASSDAAEVEVVKQGTTTMVPFSLPSSTWLSAHMRHTTRWLNASLRLIFLSTINNRANTKNMLEAYNFV